MSATPASPLRVALLEHGFETEPTSAAARATRVLGLALAARGQEPTVIACGPGPEDRSHQKGLEVIRVRRLPEMALRVRGFAGPLTQIPFTLAALRRGQFDIVHAFTALDAQPALLWRRATRTPAVFTCCEPPARENLADRRGRLRIATDAFGSADRVTSATAEVGDAATRWLAVDLPTVAPGDAASYERIYRACLDRGVPAPGGRRS